MDPMLEGAAWLDEELARSIFADALRRRLLEQSISFQAKALLSMFFVCINEAKTTISTA